MGRHFYKYGQCIAVNPKTSKRFNPKIEPFGSPMLKNYFNRKVKKDDQHLY